MLGAHLIPNHFGQSDEDQLRRLQPKSIKVINPDPNFLRRIFELCPDSLFVLRDHPLSEQKDDVARDPTGTGIRHANDWIGKLNTWNLPIPAWQIVVLGINEPPVWADTESTLQGRPAVATTSLNEAAISMPTLRQAGMDALQLRDEFGVSLRAISAGKALIPEYPSWIDAISRYTVAFLDALADTGIRGGALNLSVGWPDNTGPDTPPDWTPYVGIEDAIARGSHFLFLHEYWDNRGPEYNYGWWAGRFEACPWDVPIIIGETGIDQYVSDDSVPAHARGWQGQVDTDTYMAHWDFYESKLSADPRIHSYQPYTWDYSHPWSSFDVWPILPRFAPNTDFDHSYDYDNGPIDPSNDFLWPVQGSWITDLFHALRTREDGTTYHHGGLDLAVAQGTPIVASADGEIAMSTFDDLYHIYGEYIRIWHPGLNVHTFYAHMDSRAVANGDMVKAGQLIGYVGSTGHSTGPHLHYEVRIANDEGYYVDPGNGHKRGRVDPLTALTLGSRWL